MNYNFYFEFLCCVSTTKIQKQFSKILGDSYEFSVFLIILNLFMQIKFESFWCSLLWSVGNVQITKYCVFKSTVKRNSFQAHLPNNNTGNKTAESIFLNCVIAIQQLKTTPTVEQLYSTHCFLVGVFNFIFAILVSEKIKQNNYLL